MPTRLSFGLTARITSPEKDQFIFLSTPSRSRSSSSLRRGQTSLDLPSSVGTETAGNSAATDWRTDVIWIERKRGGGFGDGIGGEGREIWSVESERHLWITKISETASIRKGNAKH